MQAGHAPNEPSLDAQRIAFGRRLRALRQDRGWTLSKLAQRSGLAISTISKAERGRMALTYDRMLQLAAGMDLDMAEFFAEDGTSYAPGSFSVARRGCFRRQETPNYVYEMLFPDMRNKAMTPMTGTLKARDVMAFDEFVRHRGEEFLFVLEGQVTVFPEHRAPVTLEQGDSLYFDSAIGHVYVSCGATDARILVVCTASTPGA